MEDDDQVVVLIPMGTTPGCVAESFIPQSLLEMINWLPFLPPWIPDVHKTEMAKEVISVSVKKSLLIMAATQSF